METPTLVPVPAATEAAKAPVTEAIPEELAASISTSWALSILLSSIKALVSVRIIFIPNAPAPATATVVPPAEKDAAKDAAAVTAFIEAWDTLNFAPSHSIK